MSRFTLGVDIGGTHITAAVVDLANRRLLHESIVRQPVDASGSVANIIWGWSGAMRAAMSRSNERSELIGIAMPGPFDYENGVALMQNQDKYDALYGINVKALLAQSLQIDLENIKFENDASCFMKGEAFGGAAHTFNSAIGLTLGTGLGSAVIVNGRSWDANLWDTPFQDGIAEAYLSSRWFVKRFCELSGKKATNVKSIADQFSVDVNVRQLFSEFAGNLALFLSNFVKQEDPEVVVLGGNIAKAFPLFGEELQMKLRERDIFIPVKIAALGEEAALLGAASLWQDRSNV